MKELGDSKDEKEKRGRGRPRKEIESGSIVEKEKRGRGRPRKEIDPLATQKPAKTRNNVGIPKKFASLIESLQMGNNTIVVLPASPTSKLTTILTTSDQNNFDNNAEKTIELDSITNQVTIGEIFHWFCNQEIHNFHSRHFKLSNCICKQDCWFHSSVKSKVALNK